MFHTCARHVIAMLVLAAAATSCSTVAPSLEGTEQTLYQPAPRTVPDVLVGIWDGDRADITINPIGGFRLSYPNGLVIDGSVVLDGPRMIVTLPHHRFVAAWSVQSFDAGYGYRFLNLTIDGVSYVRDL